MLENRKALQNDRAFFYFYCINPSSNALIFIRYKMSEIFEKPHLSEAEKHPDFQVIVWSSRRNIALSFRHALYSRFLLSFDWGVSQYSAMWKNINVPHTYEEWKVKTLFSVNPKFSLKGIPSFALLWLGQTEPPVRFELITGLRRRSKAITLSIPRAYSLAAFKYPQRAQWSLFIKFGNHSWSTFPETHIQLSNSSLSQFFTAFVRRWGGEKLPPKSLGLLCSWTLIS